MFYHEAIGIFGIKQESLQVLRLPSEVIHQYPLIKHHLDEMILLMTPVVFIPFSRFLFHKYLEILLKHIDTSLQAKLFADERSLQQGIVLVESLNIMWQYIVYKRADVHHLCLRLLVKVGGNRAGTKLQSR